MGERTSVHDNERNGLMEQLVLLFLTVVLTIVVMVLDQSYNLFEGGCIYNIIYHLWASSISIYDFRRGFNRRYEEGGKCTCCKNAIQFSL